MEAVSNLLFIPFQQIALTMLKSAVVRPFSARRPWKESEVFVDYEALHPNLPHATSTVHFRTILGKILAQSLDSLSQASVPNTTRLIKSKIFMPIAIKPTRPKARLTISCKARSLPFLKAVCRTRQRGRLLLGIQHIQSASEGYVPFYRCLGRDPSSGERGRSLLSARPRLFALAPPPCIGFEPE